MPTNTTDPTITAPVTRAAASRRGDRPTLSPGDTVTVLPWHDSTIEQMPGAMPTDSDDAQIWYTPSIGCISMAMAQRFARYAADGPSIWTVADIAGTFGISAATARVGHSFDRLELFGIAHRDDRRDAIRLHVRLWLAPLTFRQRSQLPDYLAAAYADRNR